MGMTLKELLTKGEGTLSAQEAKDLSRAECIVRIISQNSFRAVFVYGIHLLASFIVADTCIFVSKIKKAGEQEDKRA